MSRRETHTALIKLNGIREGVLSDVEVLENRRGSVKDNQRKLLEYKIGRNQQYIKDLDYIELDLREKL